MLSKIVGRVIMSMFRFQVSNRIPLGTGEVAARFSGFALEITARMSNLFALTAATVTTLEVYEEVLITAGEGVQELLKRANRRGPRRPPLLDHDPREDPDPEPKPKPKEKPKPKPKPKPERPPVEEEDFCPTLTLYFPLDHKDRAQAAIAILDKKTVGGAYSKFDIWPGWWWDDLPVLGFYWERGHLLGSQLGGTGGKNLLNLIALSPTSNGIMSRFESQVAAAAKNQCVWYHAWAGYIGDEYYPSMVFISAKGDKDYSLNVKLFNP